MAHNNPRYECKGCNHRPTRNQLRGSNGVCIYCKTPMHHTAWLGGQVANIFQLMCLSKGDQALLESIAGSAEVNAAELVRAAVQKSLTTWETAHDPAVTAKADIILGKLSQR